ncbi:MAG: acetoin utilization protein AcuC [Thermodesulfobacteriota bacterium]
MNTAFIYTDEYLHYDYGPTHPLRIVRLKLTYELIKAYGLLDFSHVELIQTQPAQEEELSRFHSEAYLSILKKANTGYQGGEVFAYGLGPGDNPIFPGLLDWSLLVTGATFQAIDFVASGRGSIAFNIAGGLHHAMRERASGFCYINDPVIGILKLLDQGMRVAYIDIDAHHGDGVQKAFYGTDQVLTISLHQSGYSLFPGTGFEYEIGEGRGEGFSINLPFPPYTEDETYLWTFDEVVPELIERFKPDVLVTQLGVDAFFDDPLTNLQLSIYGYEKIIQRIKELSPRWVALGGGGYNISNVARAWTLAWAIMNGVELGEEIPESYLKLAESYGVKERRLRGDRVFFYSRKKENRLEMERVIRYLKDRVFPKVHP